MTPPLGPKHEGMKMSAEGLIIRAAQLIPKGEEAGGYRWALTEQLLVHLKELGRRYYEGDALVVDEFLQLYDLDDNRPKEGE